MPLRIQITLNRKKIEKVFLNARKTIDGNIIISDHPEIDIFLLVGKSKIVALPKDELDDEVYDTQNRMFTFLARKGIVDFESIQGGNIFMSMEARILDATDGEKTQFALYVISKFIDKELPFYKNQKEFEKEVEKNLLEPEVDEYTEFDTDKYHRETKGSLPPRYARYGINSIYRI
tara:strand:- start:455 stop:982 length:528 start_codon:yes stop_codon:yes gene_type:complete